MVSILSVILKLGDIRKNDSAKMGTACPRKIHEVYYCIDRRQKETSRFPISFYLSKGMDIFGALVSFVKYVLLIFS